MRKERNSSLEVIRIICMFYIVYWHSVGPYLDQMASVSLAPMNLINSLCNNTNTLFMLLSGYFGIRLNLEKLIKLDIAIIFYDVVFLLIFRNFGIGALISAVMPITFKTHWFLSCYFMIALLSGFLNMIPDRLPRKVFRNLLLALIAIFYLLPTLFFRELIEDGGKGIVCMTIVYLVGRYIRLYYEDISFKKSRLAVVFWATILIPSVLDYGLSLIRGVFMGMYCRDNSIFMLISSIALLLFFREIHFTSRFINHLTPNIVILYCIEGSIRELAGRYFDLGSYSYSPLFAGIAFLFALAVIVLCLLLNELRTLLLDRVDGFLAHQVMRLLQKLAPGCIHFVKKIYSGTLAFLEGNK